MSDPVLLVSRFHKTAIPVDGREIRILVDRFTEDQFRAFAADFTRVDDPPSERALLVRLPGEEQETRPKVRPRTPAEIAAIEALERIAPVCEAGEVGADLAIVRAAFPLESDDREFVIGDAEIRRRRLAEMSPEQRAEWQRQADEDEAHATQFLRAVAAYVHIPRGQIAVEGDNGERQDVTEGTELMRLFAAHVSVRRAMATAVWCENTLPTALKNTYRSAFGSGVFSPEPDRVASGATPEAPAASASAADSATSAAVTASTEDEPCGLMETSHSERVQSLRSRRRLSMSSAGLT